MASIRLFGRGRTQAAPGGSPVSAAQIAQVLEQVATASLSATWRCRHTAGTSIGEGAVDFGARRSRATVIRGRYAFEYVRSGSTVYRTVARVEEQGANGEAAAASSRPAAVTAQVEQEEQEEQERDGSDLEPGEEDLDRERELFEPEGGGEGEAEDSDGGEHAESEDVEEPGESGGSDLEAEADADDSEDDADDPGDDAEDADGDDSDDDGNGGVKGGRDDLRWQTFSEHDPCGMHAYA
ncbi:MAG: hypothetical protein ACRDSS_15965, partial [Actinocrinis sp.]